MSEGVTIALLGFLGAVLAAFVAGAVAILSSGLQNKNKGQTVFGSSLLTVLLVCAAGAVTAIFMVQGSKETTTATAVAAVTITPTASSTFAGFANVAAPVATTVSPVSTPANTSTVAILATVTPIVTVQAKDYLERGKIYFDQKDYNSALTQYNRAIELDNKNALAYTTRGNTFYMLKSYQQALADFTRAVELDAKYALAYYNRGLTYKAMGNQKTSKSDFEKAADLGSDAAKTELKKEDKDD